MIRARGGKFNVVGLTATGGNLTEARVLIGLTLGERKLLGVIVGDDIVEDDGDIGASLILEITGILMTREQD